MDEKTRREMEYTKKYKDTFNKKGSGSYDEDGYDEDGYDDDGVVYTPSRWAGAPKTKAQPAVKPRSDTKPGAAVKPPIKRKRSNYTVFMFITIGVGLIVCLIALVVMFNIFSSKIPPATKTPSDKAGASENTNLFPVEGLITVTGVIESISAKSFVVYELESEKISTFHVDGKTDLRNRYGTVIAPSELKVGDIVDVGYTSSIDPVVSVQLNVDAWESRSITNVIVNAESMTVSIGNKTYSYNKELIILSKDKLSRIEELSPSDVVTVTGYKDKLLTVNIEKAQAYLEVLPNEKIIDGIIEIGTSLYMQLVDAGKIQLSEGLHRIVVKGTNIEPFTKELRLQAGDTAVLDLSDVQIKVGAIVVKSNVTDYKLYVNEELQQDNALPLVLEYGKYTIRAEKEEYLPFETEVVVARESYTLDVVLEPEIKHCTATINATPINSEVYIDNIFTGLTPLTTEIQFGEHVLTLRKDGYVDAIITINVTEPEWTYHANLDKKPDTIPDTTQSTPITPSVPTGNTGSTDATDSFEQPGSDVIIDDEPPDWLGN